MNKKVLIIILIISILVPLLSGCLEEDINRNSKPIIEIEYPVDGTTVSSLVMISGISLDLDGDNTIEKVEIKINGSEWDVAEGTSKWSFDWLTYKVEDGYYTIYARAWDGVDYSDIEEIYVKVDNLKSRDTGLHKWAVFIAAANFPIDNESKLGNGGLYLAEQMSTYFIEQFGYPTSNIYILFDDGFIRDDNGYGKKIETLQERRHKYDITYGGATKENVENVLNHVIKESNNYDDSEVFIWIFSHGCGDEHDKFTGGKLLESSSLFLWDEILTDHELGDLLYDLRSKKTCIIVDACFSGGFADKTIYSFPAFPLLFSNIPGDGRVVISGASKYRVGYASTVRGPLFSLLWFEGIQTGDADGFKPGIRDFGRRTFLGFHKDGKISVEEAFYYARYQLRIDESFEEYKKMEPQINDQYPRKGHFRNNDELILGQ